MTDATTKLKDVEERLAKVAFFEPAVARGGRDLDGIQVLLDDARWLAQQLRGALAEIDRLSPREVA